MTLCSSMHESAFCCSFLSQSLHTTPTEAHNQNTRPSHNNNTKTQQREEFSRRRHRKKFKLSLGSDVGIKMHTFPSAQGRPKLLYCKSDIFMFPQLKDFKSPGPETRACACVHVLHASCICLHSVKRSQPR